MPLLWATNHASRIKWGKGEQYGTFAPVIEHGGAEHKPIQVWTGDYLYIMFSDMKARPHLPISINALSFFVA